MNRDELIDALQTARARLDASIEGLTAEELTRPGVVGDWSVKDLLAHVTAWDVDLLTNLGKLKRGQKPGQVVWDKASIQAQNEAWHAEYKTRPLERVLADYDGVHVQIMKRVDGMTDAELQAALAQRRGEPLWKYFQDHILIHEDEHAAEIENWRNAKKT